MLRGGVSVTLTCAVKCRQKNVKLTTVLANKTVLNDHVLYGAQTSARRKAGNQKRS